MNYQTLSNKYISDSQRKLNILLASLHIYYQNLRTFHWKVQGPNFFELHKQFESMYQKVSENIDDIAERLLALQANPISQLSEYLIISELEEASDELNTKEMLEKILSDQDILIQSLRFLVSFSNQHADEGTADMLVAMLREVEKESWMVRAYLRKNTSQ
ncbi:MAG: DNA starvation/stationary phase protection protein [Bacteroidota bacterium]